MILSVLGETTETVTSASKSLMYKILSRLEFVFVFLGCLAALSGFSLAQSASETPVELVRATVEKELKSNTDGGKFMFADHKRTPHGDETKLVVETQQATAGLVIARNGHPLTGSEKQDEHARVQRFINNPSELERKENKEAEDRQHTIEIVRALPDAFVYEADGTEPGKEGIGKLGDELVRLKFRPNPKYNPPSHVEQVLVGMEGYLLIDASQHRIAKIDGTLFKDVEFGWGILGRLDRGGQFLVEQADEGSGQWELTHMNLQMQGRLLLVKKLMIQSNETFSSFHRVPDNLTFAEGLHLLEEEEQRMNQNPTVAATAK